MSTPFYKKARSHLVRSCPVMKQLIGTVGPCTLAPTHGDTLTLLVRCVISQQISTKAARSIFEKLKSVVGAQRISLEKLERMNEEDLKVCGISGPKQRTLRAITDHVRANPTFLEEIVALDEETIHERMTAIKGIGPWTADMFLIFGIMRPDVLPVGDYGVRMAIKNQFHLRKMPDPAKCRKLGKSWRPYRSIASWYLWRSLEPQYQWKKA